jgi:TnpA family transposase
VSAIGIFSREFIALAVEVNSAHFGDGQFYASLESGHTTASVALQRLVSCTAKNHFYRANRDLGRIFKTEFLLSYLSEPRLRARPRNCMSR